MSNYDMAWYFDRGLERGAVLLDESTLNRNDYPLFTVFRDELRSIARGEGMELGYSYPGGKRVLKDLIAEHESYVEGTEIYGEDVVVNSGGCSGTFDNTFRVIEKESRSTQKTEMVIPTPSYPEIFKSIVYNELRPVYVPTRRDCVFQPTYQDIERVLTDRTAGIFITTPGNPACTYIGRDVMRRIAQDAMDIGCYLIVDTIFEESPGVTIQQRTFSECQGYRRLIKIRGWSKDRPQLNDIRLGWSVCKDPAINRSLVLASELSDYSNSTILERIAISDMQQRVLLDRQRQGLAPEPEDPKLRRYIQELEEYQGRTRTALDGALKLLRSHPYIADAVTPEAGNIIFARVRDNPRLGNTHDLFMHFLDTVNILVSPGHIFKAPEDELWFRITVSMSPEKFIGYTQRLLESLGAL